MRKPQPANLPLPILPVLPITNLDLEGRGIGHNHEGKVVFVEGALTTESVRYASYSVKKNWEAATLVEILRTSNLRVPPKCPHFDICGGCALQHLDPSAQVAFKARFLEDSLWHIGKVKTRRVLPPIFGAYWNYRHKARLAVRWVDKKNKLLIGFHEKKSSFVADISECHTLHQNVASRLRPLRELIVGLSISREIPQIEVAVTPRATAFAFRVLAPPTKEDCARMTAFAQEHSSPTEEIQIWLQTGNESTLAPLYPTKAQLEYQIQESAVSIAFLPSDFTQVNHSVNEVLVSTALRYLQLQSTDSVLDLFCGLGNFSLPIARTARTVLGVEGAKGLVNRARENAQRNQLGATVDFAVHNLFEIAYADFWALGNFDRYLIDPPREGAAQVCQHLKTGHENGKILPHRIVYVSCNPATLARDAATLVHGAGYTLDAAGVINMFPHTAHVESIAVFTRTDSSTHPQSHSSKIKHSSRIKHFSTTST